MDSNTENSLPSILVVDDNEENLTIVGTFLMDEGYQLALAGSAREALEVLRENDISLILLDVMMPETDGFTFCRQLKADPALKEIPVIFITAKTETTDIVEGFHVGGVDYITKPFHLAELKARVENHMNLSLAKRTILKQAEELGKLSRAKDRLYSVIAHDIKSPFSNISMLISAISEGYLEPGSPEYDEILQNINISTKDTYALLENLLQWTRSQTGDLEVRPEPIDLNNLIQSAVQFFEPNAVRKKISLTKCISEPIIMSGDKTMIQSVLHNLINNAIKFTPEGGKVSVVAKIQNEKIILKISDTGIGIPKENIEKIMDEEAMISTRGTNDEKGSGLGLLLVKYFVTKNRGELSFASKVGGGTTFTLTFNS